MGMQGDFVQLLKEQGYQVGGAIQAGGSQDAGRVSEIVCATTILAVKYRDGLLVAGDRRATSGNTVMYDRTDKVLELDRHSVMAIAGVPATAYEMARVLEHSFKYYRRTQLQELSFEGKLRALSNLLKENVPAALAGTGAVAPIFAGYDVDQGSGRFTSMTSWERNSKGWNTPCPAPGRPLSEGFCTISMYGANNRSPRCRLRRRSRKRYAC